MTTKTLIFCETCPRSEEASGSEERGWARLGVNGSTLDICSTCVAKLKGWRGDAVTKVPSLVPPFKHRNGRPRAVNIVGAL